MPHIVIEVPEPTPTLYLVAPAIRDTNLDRLAEDVTFAALLCGLRINRFHTSILSQSDTLFQEIVHNITAARVIAALFIDSHTTACLDCETFYQVGYAQSRGKSIIIITPHNMTPFPRLHKSRVCTYAPQDLGSPQFLSDLRSVIADAAADAAPIGLTSTHSYPHTWASLHHNWLNNPDFFEDFLQAMQVAHSCTRLLQRITHAQIDSLLRHIDEIITFHHYLSPESESQRVLERRVGTFRAAWKQYVVNYYIDYLPELRNLINLVANVITLSLAKLSESALRDSKTIIDRCTANAKSLSLALNRYLEDFTVTVEFVEGVLDDIVCGPDISSAVSARLTSISRQGKGIMIKAVALHHSLLALPL